METTMGEKMYTQEQLEIALIKQKNNTFEQTLLRLEQKVDSHYHWIIGLMVGLYVTVLTTILGKVFNWF